jgi:hypothetical protein
MVYRGDTLLGSQISELKTDSFIRFKIKWIILFERQRSTRSRRSLSFFSSPAKRQAACLATRLGYRVRAKCFYGIRTASMTWITPLLASMSVLTTFAPPTVTLPSCTLMASFLPFTVFALVVLTSAAINSPGRTW